MKTASRVAISVASLTIASLALLAGCGGGGDGSTGASSDGTATVLTAEGAYAGTLTGASANAFNLIVLEDGSYWAIYGNLVSNTLFVSGFVQGTGRSSNGNFSSTDAKDFGYAPAVAGTVTATYVAGTSISGTVSVPGAGSSSFSGSTAGIAPYSYSAAANLSDIAGSWNMALLSGDSASVVIAPAGSFTGVASDGCQFTGTIAPRASGKNVFNVSMTLGGGPCLPARQTVTGIGVYSRTTAGTNQLIIGVVDTARTLGTTAIGQR